MSPARRLRARSSASPAARRSQSVGGRASYTFCRRAPAYPTQRRAPPSAHLSPAISSPLSSRQNRIRYVLGDSRTSRRASAACHTGCSRCAPGSCGSADRSPRGCCPRQYPVPHIRRGFRPRLAGTRPAPPSLASTKRAPCRGQAQARRQSSPPPRRFPPRPAPRAVRLRPCHPPWQCATTGFPRLARRHLAPYPASIAESAVSAPERPPRRCAI